MSAEKSNGFFATMYCNRIKVTKDGVTIVNLSLLFGIVALLTALWLVVVGVIAALALGYKFSFVRRAEGFNGNFNEVVEEAKGNVRNAVDNVTDHTQA